MFASIKSQEKIDFAKSLSVMLKSGISLNEALHSLVEETQSKSFKKLLMGLEKDVLAGNPLSVGLLREKKHFGAVSISLIKAGEQSGTLEEDLEFLSAWLERNEDLRQEIKAATLYPKFVVAATAGLGGALAIYILPKLIPLFNSLHVKLPLATKMLLAFSLFIQNQWAWIIVGAASVVALFIFLNSLKPFRRAIDGISLRLPFIGTLFVDYELALISELLATLFRSGLLMNESLSIVSDASTNLVYKDSLEKIRQRVDAGSTLADSMRVYPKLYPPNLINIVATGERSGTLDSSFRYMAEYYSKEVSHKTKKLPTIIEPALLIFIALLVGFVAISIIMPIYELTRGISQ
jgi:type II secretory pathway component PulF